MPASGCQAPPARTMSAITRRMITVRIKVAKSELMSWTPILPKMAVRAAKTADIAAQNCQAVNRDFISNSGDHGGVHDGGWRGLPLVIRIQKQDLQTSG